MIDRHAKAAVLASLLMTPDSALHVRLRALDVEAAWDAFARSDPSIPAALRDRWQRTDAERLLAYSHHVGARILTPDAEGWPQQLSVLGPLEPWALWVSGAGADALGAERSVAVVGARSATHYGEQVAGEIAVGIAEAGYPVISGGAYGIDAAAHRGALAVDGITIAVLACGVDRVYPATNAALFERIRERGCLVSESPPGMHPTRIAFLVRNRIIAALASGTVVVEARQRSGSLSTYRHARACNRLLMAVPGPVTSAESAGTHALLKEDAQLVTCADDVLELTAPLGTVDATPEAQPRREWDTLGAGEQAVHERLPARGAISTDALISALASDLTIAQILASLAALAARGIVTEQEDGGWRRLRRLRDVDGAAA